MKTTIFELHDGTVEASVTELPDWRPMDEYDGKPLDNVRYVDLLEPPHALVQLVEISAGGSFAMHASPDVAFCQIIRGRGKLGLHDGRELPYAAPELYVFLPGTLHDWHDVEEDTLLSVCLIRQLGSRAKG
jgi:quercetin dioxygenase-like cupin family protein